MSGGWHASPPGQTNDTNLQEEMEMAETNSIVVVYDTHAEAEAGVRELQKAAFDVQKLSVLGKDYHTEEYVVGYYSTGDRMKYWGKTGDFWGGLWSSLAGAAFFSVPGIGPVLIAGPLAALVIGALEGSVVVDGLSVIGAGLFGIGIPKDSIFRYESAVKGDKFLLVAHGTAGEVMIAKELLRITQPAEVNVHFAVDSVLNAA
jgi:hypothetical protein